MASEVYPGSDMSTRASSRTYNTIALETWFTHLTLDWEPVFGPEALKAGRNIYHKGQISSLELNPDEAIVHCTFTRKDSCYAIIEWSDRRPVVRSSTPDKELGDAVAVAGLYEMEELIADEVDPLPYEPKPAPTSKPDISDARPVKAPVAPRLRLNLEGLEAGLCLTAYWPRKGNLTEPAFRHGLNRLSTAQREVLVRLTGLAQKAGFRFRRNSKDFILFDPIKMAEFLMHTRKEWASIFGPLHLNSEAKRMAKGVRDVKVVGRVEPAGKARMRINWQLKLGQQWLSPADTKGLVNAKPGIRRVPGFGLVRISREQSAALNEWHLAADNPSEKTRTWARYMVFSLFGENGTELELEEELSAWRKHLPEEQDRPGSRMPSFLRPYQKQGVLWMARLRDLGGHGLLADEMGLGKTLQVLTLLHLKPFKNKSSLIVCPASVVPVWKDEARRRYPDIQIEILHSGNDFRNHPDNEPKLWIASYTQLRRHKHLLNEFHFGYAALDEAQQIKNPEAKITRICSSIQADCRLALTGTPVENRLLDLWTLFRFLMPGLLGSRQYFENALETPRPKFQKRFEQQLRKQLAPFILRRQKNNVAEDLPPKLEIDLFCPMTGLQKQVYRNLLNQGLKEFGNVARSAIQTKPLHLFSLLTRLRQACCDPGLLPGQKTDLSESGKIQVLLARLEETLENNRTRKVVIFSQFVRFLKRLKPVIQENFPKVTLLELTGTTKDRSKPVRSFQKEEGPAVILVSLRAGNTGITLHRADYVFLLDPWWNPAVENQAVDRVHRIGQTQPVFVYRMITKGTIEERIQVLKKEKKSLFENTLGHLGATKSLVEHLGELEELVRLLKKHPE